MFKCSKLYSFYYFGKKIANICHQVDKAELRVQGWRLCAIKETAVNIKKHLMYRIQNKFVTSGNMFNTDTNATLKEKTQNVTIILWQ